jgi:hypothetical protein
MVPWNTRPMMTADIMSRSWPLFIIGNAENPTCRR